MKYQIVDRNGRPILDDADRRIEGNTEAEAIRAFDVTFFVPFSARVDDGYRVESESSAGERSNG